VKCHTMDCSLTPPISANTALLFRVCNTDIPWPSVHEGGNGISYTSKHRHQNLNMDCGRRKKKRKERKKCG